MKQILNEWRKYLAEEEERKVNIFLDMDGVLVDFPSALKIHIKRVYSMDPHEVHPESKNSRRVLRKLQRMQLNDEEIDKLYDRSEYKFQSGEDYDSDEKMMSDYVFKALLKNEKLWLGMKKLVGADEVVATAFELADNVFILSAHVDPTSKVAKKKWIKHHYPGREFAGVEIRKDKGQRLRELIASGIISEDDLNILLDDRRLFLQNFIDAGGTGIQYNFESPSEALGELAAIVGN